jgi:DNA-binding MarR family transcriptional regulator
MIVFCKQPYYDAPMPVKAEADRAKGSAASAARQVSDLPATLLSLVRGMDRVHSSGALIARSGIALDRGLHPVLMTIGRLEPVRVTELATALALDNSTTSRHVNRLERLGLVVRTVDPEDARASLLASTAAGRETRDALNRAWDQIIAEQLALAGDGERQAIAEQIAKLVVALELLPVPRAPGPPWRSL